MHVRLQRLILQERMHGGTDMALAIQTASMHMQTALPPGGLQTLLILSDGFIDKYQGVSHPSPSNYTDHKHVCVCPCQDLMSHKGQLLRWEQ